MDTLLTGTLSLWLQCLQGRYFREYTA